MKLIETVSFSSEFSYSFRANIMFILVLFPIMETHPTLLVVYQTNC